MGNDGGLYSSSAPRNLLIQYYPRKLSTSDYGSLFAYKYSAKDEAIAHANFLYYDGEPAIYEIWMAVAEPYPNLDKTTVIYEETFNEYGLYARIYRHGIANFKTHYSAPYLHLYNDGEDESGYDDVVIVISPSTLTKLIEYLSDLVERDT